MLLACLGVYFAKKFRFGFIYGGVVLAFSVAIYQVYISFAAGLFIMILLLNALKKEENCKTLLIKAAKYLSSLVIGLILYFVLLNIITKITGTELTDYQGINKMNTSLLSGFLDKLSYSYVSFFKFFIEHPFWFFGPKYPMLKKIIFLLPMFFMGVMALMHAKNLLIKKSHNDERDHRKKSGFLNIVIFFLLLIIFPVSVNLVRFIDAEFVHYLMLFPLSLVFVLAISMMDKLDGALRYFKLVPKYFGVVVCWFTIVLFIFLPYNYFVVMNSSYLRSDLAMKQLYYISSTLTQRIKSFPGYQEGMTVYFINARYPGSSSNVMALLNQYSPKEYALTTETIFNYRWGYNQFAPIFLGEYVYIYNLSNRDIINQNREIFSELAVYPTDGSITIIDGVMYIRMSEHF